MVRRSSQASHDIMIENLAGLLTAKGYKHIQADIPGHTPPRKIVWESTGEGHIPDITAFSAELRIFEVETADSITDDHTADQWKLFASYAMANNALFYIVFPKGCAEAVQNRLDALQIKALLFESI